MRCSCSYSITCSKCHDVLTSLAAKPPATHADLADLPDTHEERDTHEEHDFVSCDLRRTEEELIVVERILKQLTSAKCALQNHAAVQRCRLSALSRFPNEVLRLIFAEACFKTGNNIVTMDLPALRLSRVSRRWRSICLDYPRLWAKVVISDVGRHSGDYRNPTHEQNAKHILQQSRDAPLVIDIRNQWETPDEDGVYHISPGLSYLLDVFLPHSRRWASLTVREDAVTKMLGSGVDLSNLSSLDICNTGHVQIADALLKAPPRICHCPRLETEGPELQRVVTTLSAHSVHRSLG